MDNSFEPPLYSFLMESIDLMKSPMEHPLLQQSEWFGMKCGLANMQEALELFNHPENSFQTIHLAGTNGKGSTARFLAAGLQASGYTCGLYTSPHLISLCERFIINGKPVSPSAVIKTLDTLQDTLSRTAEPPSLTFFEICTLVAFLLFKEHQVSWAVLETGLGGRLDATNVVHSPWVLLTSLGLDHEQYLGNAMSDIAREKAGIIHNEASTLLGPMDEALVQVVRHCAPRAHLDCYGLSFCLTPMKPIGTPWLYESEGPFHQTQFLPGCPAYYQHTNYALALRQLEKFHVAGTPIDLPATLKHWEQLICPGRFEILSTDPLTIIDAAHNPQGLQALIQAIQWNESPHSWQVIVGFSADKDASSMLQHLVQAFENITLVPLDHERSANTKALYEQLTPDLQQHILLQSSLTEAYRSQKKNKPCQILITGSIFLLEEAYKCCKRDARVTFGAA